uniref:NAC domain-containing protein n=1 Tax=Kalanchoe fedtschenkoi TaxID=63787 RepID=A0A7N0UJQ1_KALFE
MEDDASSLGFKPSDKQLLDYFLRRKQVEGRELHRDSLSLIPEIDDIYGQRPPWEIFPDLREHYAFTKLVKLSDGGSRVNRKVNGGFWKLQKNDDVFDVDETSGGDERVIRSKWFGKKKMLSFMSREGKMAKTSHWNMSEYTLPEWKHGDWVLCHVRFNHKAAAREEEKAAKDAVRMKGNVEEQEAAASNNTFMKEQEDYVHAAPSLEWTCQDPNQLQPRRHSAQQQDLEVRAAGNVATVNENEFMQGVDSWEAPDHDFFLGLTPVDCIPPTQDCGLSENQERDAITDSVAEVALMQNNVDPWNPNDIFLLGDLDANQEELQQGVDSWEPPDNDFFLDSAPVDCVPSPPQECGSFKNQKQDATTGGSMAQQFVQKVDSWVPSDTFIRDLDAWAADEFAKMG